LQVEPLTVSHQAIGATLLGVLVAFTVLALRDWATSREIKAYSVVNEGEINNSSL
jgi:heme a synthase